MSHNSNSKFVTNITQFKRRINAEIEISSFEDLSKTIIECNNTFQKVYTISTGYNWGLGSKVPPEEDCTIINLKKLNTILDYNEKYGTVTIEPGVTQKQLMNYLEQKNSPLFIDVTGSSKDTSIIGNTLERGITYSGQRNDSVIALEIMSAEGKVIRTGSWRLDGSKTQEIYKHGIGVNLTELFFQSNFGIVTKAKIKLKRKKKYNKSILLQFKNESDIANSLNAFNYLFQNNIIDSVFHIANKERALGAIIPHLKKEMLASQTKEETSHLVKLLAKNLSTDWVASGFISANSKQEIRFKSKMLKKQLTKFSKIQIIDFSLLDFITLKLNFLKKLPIIQLAKTTLPFKLLYTGKTTDAALGSVVDFDIFNNKNFAADDVDKSSKGFAYCLPLIPMNKNDFLQSQEIINNVSLEYQFNPAITLNPLKENLLELVISIQFTKDEKEKASQYIRELQINLNKNGYYSYRTNINDMDLYFTEKDYCSILQKLKNVFDPNNILSPGRYLSNRKT